MYQIYKNGCIKYFLCPAAEMFIFCATGANEIQLIYPILIVYFFVKVFCFSTLNLK